MKKQNNSVSIMSVKSRISVTVLCALLGATEVNASNYPSVGLNTISKELKADPKNESGVNRFATWTGNTSEVVEEEQIIDVIARWVSDSSYWSSEDTLVNDRKISDNSVRKMNNDNCNGNKPVDIKPFRFNAENYILNSEF